MFALCAEHLGHAEKWVRHSISFILLANVLLCTLLVLVYASLLFLKGCFIYSSTCVFIGDASVHVSYA